MSRKTGGSVSLKVVNLFLAPGVESKQTKFVVTMSIVQYVSRGGSFEFTDCLYMLQPHLLVEFVLLRDYGVCPNVLLPGGKRALNFGVTK